MVVPDLVLFAMGRLDLVLYTSAGALCALYGHGLPYAARARTLPWVVLGMVASVGVALTAASLTTSTALLVVFAALVAAIHKTVCDATRIGPPGNIILTFVTASAFFVPQRLGQVPGHLALTLGTGILAWLVCMAPALLRPQGPERIVVARALEAAAGLLRTDPVADGARPAGATDAWHAATAAANAAWQTLYGVPAHTPAKAAARAGLERLLVEAESVLGSVGRDVEGGTGREAGWAAGTYDGRHYRHSFDDDFDRASGQGSGRASSQSLDQRFGQSIDHGIGQDCIGQGFGQGFGQDLRRLEAERLSGWARELRGGGPVPEVAGVASSWQVGEEEVGGEVAGVRRPAPGQPRGVRPVLARIGPGSPLLPMGARVAAGCVLAGWTSMALGVGHPYWAVVTAASIYQANTTLTWQRALQRTLGNVSGLLLYTALLPLIHLGPLAMIVLALACQVGAEAWISRNYWLASTCVTPLALLLSGFGSQLPARTLIADRWIDTVVGAAVGLACCLVVTNRRAADRIEVALERVAAAEAAASQLLATRPAARASGTERPACRASGTERSAPPGTEGADGAREAGWARDRLAGCLVELREAVEVASGEWWQRALPEERIDHAQQQGHRTLVRLVRRLRVPVAAA
ncbi:FUSC family protein [Streptomyces kronopolitis]|uniref:FUSC family protein n=1 Tax=Streptomyces kronopolitis TaxID=1612435 RepID=UPI0020BDFE83|nr:FUSC family protein [Streptomyces kronopolitis]MCL6301531.1 FUSC family protein [Streptomyces kronopolitis]